MKQCKESLCLGKIGAPFLHIKMFHVLTSHFMGTLKACLSFFLPHRKTPINRSCNLLGQSVVLKFRAQLLMPFLTNKPCCSCVSSATPSHHQPPDNLHSYRQQQWPSLEGRKISTSKLQDTKNYACHALNKKETVPKHVKILQEEKHKHDGSM